MPAPPTPEQYECQYEHFQELRQQKSRELVAKDDEIKRVREYNHTQYVAHAKHFGDLNAFPNIFHKGVEAKDERIKELVGQGACG